MQTRKPSTNLWEEQRRRRKQNRALDFYNKIKDHKDKGLKKSIYDSSFIVGYNLDEISLIKANNDWTKNGAYKLSFEETVEMFSMMMVNSFVDNKIEIFDEFMKVQIEAAFKEIIESYRRINGQI